MQNNTNLKTKKSTTLNKFLRVVVPALLVTPLAFYLSGCNKEEAKTANEPTQATKPAYAPPTEATGNILDKSQVELAKDQVYNMNFGTLDSLDPSLVSGGEELIVDKELFDSLVRLNNHGEYIPVAAQSWDVSPDGKTYTFHLRPEAKWQDGKPVTAQDFVYAFHRLVDPKTAAPYADYLGLINVENAADIPSGKKPVDSLGIEAPDDHTFVVKLTKPTPWFIQAISLPILVPLRQDLIEKYGDQWVQPGNLVGNGPFKLTEYKPNDNLKLVKDPNYWGAKDIAITNINVDFLTDPNTVYFGYLQNKYPLAGIKASQFPQMQKERPNEIISYVLNQANWIYINNKRITDVRVREALNLLLDRNLMTAKILHNGKPTSIPFPTTLTDAQDITQQPWFDKSQADNNAEAVKLLKEAGYTKEKPLNLEFLVGTSPQPADIAIKALYEQNSDGLLKINYKVLEGKAFLAERDARNFDLIGYGWIPDYNQISTFTDIFRCNSPINIISYCNPEYDKTLDQASNEPDATKRAELYAKAADILKADYPVIPTTYSTGRQLRSPALGGQNLSLDTRYIRDYFFIANKKVAPVK